jgi:Tol biopolymer transport system component
LDAILPHRPLAAVRLHVWLAAVAMAVALIGSSPVPAAELAEELRGYPFQIVFESYRDGNWELLQAKADGSKITNLTRSSGRNELYPHVSPDGGKICFLVDEGEGNAKRRNVYVMNADGSDPRMLVANGRDPCWTRDGKGVIYLPAEFEQFTVRDYATQGISIVDLATGKVRRHVNSELSHLYNVCSTLDGGWYVATVHAGMGFGHAILAIEAEGKRVINLNIPGCRPDISGDGKKIAWGADDFTICAAELDLSGAEPRVVNRRDVVRSEKPLEAYHVDWSPDGRYIALSRGPKKKSLGPAPEMIGVEAGGWDIWVADAAATNRMLAVTTDGQSNKEPDWIPAKAAP